MGTDNFIFYRPFLSFCTSDCCQVTSCKTLVQKVKKEDATQHQKWGEQTGCTLKRSSENFTTKLINKTPLQAQTVISCTLQLRITLWDLLSYEELHRSIGDLPDAG